MAPGGPLEDVGLGIPLVVQDRTYVPSPAQVAEQDPTWDYSRWGKKAICGMSMFTCLPRTRVTRPV